jgi:hypothetical protein
VLNVLKATRLSGNIPQLLPGVCGSEGAGSEAGAVERNLASGTSDDAPLWA